MTQSTPRHRDGRSHRQPKPADARFGLDPDTGALGRSTPTAKVPEPPPPDLPPIEPDELPEDEPEPEETPAPQQPQEEPVPA